MALLKKMVAVSIEETNGTSPEDMLAKVKGVQRQKHTRIFAKDYMASMDALTRKGYSARAAAGLLIELGCPFAQGTLTQCWWQRR